MLGLEARSAALVRLIDDASLFPPAQRAIAGALAAHRAQRDGAYGAYQGRFVVPATRLDELTSVGASDDLVLSVILPGSDRVLGVGVDRGLDLVRAARDVGEFTVDAFEVRLPDELTDDDLAAACQALVQFGRGAATLVSFEIPYASGFAAPVDAVAAQLARARAAFAADGLHVTAKLRCGGLTADVVPSPEEVATFVCAAHTHRIPFKATAGLHHPVRTERAANGLHMHGFLNVLFAAIAHAAGAIDGQGVAAVIAETDVGVFALDAETFTWRGIALDAAAIGRGREHAFLSFGSCSFDEPIADLRALGMLA